MYIGPHKQSVLSNHLCLFIPYFYDPSVQYFSQEFSFLISFLLSFFLMLHYFFISELAESNFCKNSFLVTFGLKSPQNMVFCIFMEIVSFDFPKSSLKGKSLWYLTSDPSCSQLIRSQDFRKCNISKWIETWISKKGFKMYCVKSVRIRSYCGPHFPAFGRNVERCSVSPRIPSECGKMRTRITKYRNFLRSDRVFCFLKK